MKVNMSDNSYPGPESIHRHVLGNGMIVLTYENEVADSVVIEGLVRCGAVAQWLVAYCMRVAQQGDEAGGKKPLYNTQHPISPG